MRSAGWDDGGELVYIGLGNAVMHRYIIDKINAEWDSLFGSEQVTIDEAKALDETAADQQQDRHIASLRDEVAALNRYNASLTSKIAVLQMDLDDTKSSLQGVITDLHDVKSFLFRRFGYGVE